MSSTQRKYSYNNCANVYNVLKRDPCYSVVDSVCWNTYYVPNQPYLLNKCQINMGFPHFHEFGILSGMHILEPYKIDIVKGCGVCNGSIILILYWFFIRTKHFGRWKQHLFDILFLTRLCIRIHNCFYAFCNTRNTPKFEPFHIAHKPSQGNKWEYKSELTTQMYTLLILF